MKKLILLLLTFGLAMTVNAQGIRDFKLVLGTTNTQFLHSEQQTILLPDNSVGEDLITTSSPTSQFNMGLTVGFNISQNDQWQFRTGLLYQKMETGTLVNATSNEVDYIFRTANNISQLDIPLLVSWKKPVGKFYFGTDFGLVKALAVWNNTTTYTFSTESSAETKLETYSYSTSGMVNILDKFSAFAGAKLGYDFSQKIGVELQPFYRYQFGIASEFRYDNKSGAPLSQYGINLGIVKRF